MTPPKAEQQLAPKVDPGLVFVPTCAFCGAQGEPIPVEPDNWREAEAWCYLAYKNHEKACRRRGEQALPASVLHP